MNTKREAKCWSLVGRLEALAQHWYHGPRAIGHTHALRAGAENVNPVFVLTHNRAQGEEIMYAAAAKGNLAVPITLDDLTHKLRGSRAPLVADHYVMGRLLYEAAAEIRTLRSQLGAIKEVLER